MLLFKECTGVLKLSQLASFLSNHAYLITKIREISAACHPTSFNFVHKNNNSIRRWHCSYKKIFCSTLLRLVYNLNHQVVNLIYYLPMHSKCTCTVVYIYNVMLMGWLTCPSFHNINSWELFMLQTINCREGNGMSSHAEGYMSGYTISDLHTVAIHTVWREVSSLAMQWDFYRSWSSPS